MKNIAKIRIVKDHTNGLIDLHLVERVGEKRKFKVGNNYTGIVAKADAGKLDKLCELLNQQLPPVTPKEIVVGQAESGIVISYALARTRNSFFNYSTSRQYKVVGRTLTIGDSRVARVHNFYGIDKGYNVILVEDEITTGEGIMELYKILKKNQVIFTAIACVVENIDFNARDKIKQLTGLELVSLVQISNSDESNKT